MAEVGTQREDGSPFAASEPRFRRWSIGAGVLIALSLLVPARALAFRSSGDLADFDGQARVAFANPTIPVELFSEVAPDLELALVEGNLKQAAETWSAPGCSTVAISYAGTTDEPAAPADGHNTIQWVSDWQARGFPKDSPGLTDVQYAKDGDGHWTIVEADLYLNLGFDWTTGVPVDDHKSLLAVLTHELGHVLGLLHPCELTGVNGAPKCSKSAVYPSEEMYPVYSAQQTVLSDDDIAGVCFLYSAGCDDSSCAAGERCDGGTCQPLCGDAVCGAGSECKKNRCVATSKDCGAAGCVGQACTTGSDCGIREFCDGTVCARGEGALGDPCSGAEHCFDGACVDGTCAESCDAASACRSGAACDAKSGACPDALAPLGDECKFSTDCRGGYCLAEAGHAPVCSRSCEKGQPQCPSGWACREADGSPVCAPAAARDDGCSINPAPHSSEAPYALTLLAISFACWRAWRRQARRPRQ